MANNDLDVLLPEGSLPLDIASTDENEDGSVDILFTEAGIISPEEVDFEDIPYFHEENLALNPNFVTDTDMGILGTEILEDFESDRSSRSGWEDTIKKGIQQIGLKIEELSEPFEGACSATHPLILEAAVKFQSKASAELYPAHGPVRTQIMGAKTVEKEKKAARISEHMNWQILNQMPDYYPQGEKGLLLLALMGTSFKKLGFDPYTNSPASSLVSVDQFVISNFEESLEKASRYSHIIYQSYNEFLTNINSGIYKEPVGGIGEPTEPMYNEIRAKMNEILGFSYSQGTEAEVYTLIEHHCYLDFGESAEGYELPYIVTVMAESGEILSIRRNWDENDPNFKKLEWFVDYHFVPGFGFYSLGLIQLLGSTQLSLTTIQRSLVDSGQFANLQGGFKTKSLKIVGDDANISPGEWKDVEGIMEDISKAFFPLPTKEPSPTLFQMLDFLQGNGLKFADQAEQVIADSTNYGPVGTTLALLEASTKFYTAIHKRLHFSQGKELKILARINKDFLSPEYPYEVPGEERAIFASDYDGEIEVIPVSDPNISSNAHRMTLAQTKLQVAQQFPDKVNQEVAIRQFYAALSAEDVDELVPTPEQAQPLDPVSDIVAMTQGRPIKAFPGQEHDSHITVKTNWLSDASQGGNQFMQGFIPTLVANIQEHSILKWQEQMQGTVQGSEAEAFEMNEQVLAQASEKVKEANNRIAEEAMGETPAHTLAQAELLKAATEKDKVESEKFKNVAEAVSKLTKLRQEQQKINLQEREQAFQEEKEGVSVVMGALQTRKDENEREIDRILDIISNFAASSSNNPQQ